MHRIRLSQRCRAEKKHIYNRSSVNKALSRLCIGSLLTGFIYAVVQMILGFRTVSAFFMPSSDSYMVLWKAICVCLIDYIIAYTVLGFGGIFRNKIKNPSVSLCVGSIVALSMRYLAHIVSGYIFFGSWAEWFFSQEGFAIGAKILEKFSGQGLAFIYSVFYNGLYMIPEIIITAIVALIIGRIPQISGRKSTKKAK